ncbi:MAG TPA: GNAT family N-acetyltransferase [bacterium]|nr:GNAT family N-acetyltransferase [bacterium]
MKEKFSSINDLIKNQSLREMHQEIYDYLSGYTDKEYISKELKESFSITETENPLRREDIELSVEKFINDNLEKLLPIMVSRNCNDEEIIRLLGITNEQIGLIGADYYIKKINGQQKITKKYAYGDDYYEADDITPADLIALNYAKEQIRMDSSRDIGKTNEIIPHRYYLKSINRYLCSNDFGMRYWNEEEQKMTNGDVTNACDYIYAIQLQIKRICDNLHSATQQYQKDNETEYDLASILKNILENPKDKELILSASPIKKMLAYTKFHANQIADQYGIISKDPISDYNNFEKNFNKLQKILITPSTKKDGCNLQYLNCVFYKKPILLDAYNNEKSITQNIKSILQTFIMERSLNSENDEFQTFFNSHTCGRGPGSPYFYSNNELYKLIKKIGLKKAQEILETDDRRIHEQLNGLNILTDIGYNVDSLDNEQLKKQIFEANKLNSSNIWSYFEKKYREEIKNKTIDIYGNEKYLFQNEWMSILGKRKMRDLYSEGKRMYWLANKVWSADRTKYADEKFYNRADYIDWEKYDTTKINIKEEELNRQLQKNIEIIASLLSNTHHDEFRNKINHGDINLGLIINALEKNEDIRGVAVAENKQRYLEGVINGENKNDLEFAMLDWPDDFKKHVSREEIELYYEYAEDYIKLDPYGLSKYLSWRASEDGQSWNELFENVPKQKSDLDLRICLSSQTKEIRDWYKSGAEYIGQSTMQNYILRFNTTRGSDGHFLDWHDVLFWIPNITKLEKDEAKSIISSIDTADDNQEFIKFLPRYNKERDSLLGEPIQSLRELKKRIIAIESKIDLSGMPQKIVDIISAPGFNLSELQSLQQTTKFKELIDGKLDKNQPFKPHKRIFAGRQLTSAISEALGSHKKNIRGTAIDPKGLFHELNLLIKNREIDNKKMTVMDLISNVPIDLEEEIISILKKQKVDIGPTVEAQVHAKSDPEGWVCGNYTDCCMPFGDYKNNDYMFNECTQYFTIKYNGRIIAQSVVVDSTDKRNNEDVIILDNIEVANNYKNLTPLLSNAYQTFWTEYTSRPVKIGTGYSDLIPPGAELEINNYAPKHNLVYSDARGSRIYNLPKIIGVESIEDILTLSNITMRDADLIAKMESDIYPNEMTQGKTHIIDILEKQRELEVPGSASSFIIRKGKEPAGYLLALPEESAINRGEKVAHIYDMAVLPKFRGLDIVKKIMERVLDISSSYGVAIEAEARASTSYALLMNRRIREWFENKGFYLTKNEKLEKYLGGEDFYFVRFDNRQNVETDQ